MNILTDYHIDCCLDELKSHAGIIPPNRESLRDIINDKDFIDDMTKWYTKKKDGTVGLDTGERDVLFNIVSRYLIQEDWPLNMDGPDKMMEFSCKLKNAINNTQWEMK